MSSTAKWVFGIALVLSLIDGDIPAVITILVIAALWAAAGTTEGRP